MFKINSYTEWKQAIEREYGPLREVGCLYLNDRGKARLKAFDTLLRLTDFCDTAEELLESVDALDEHDRTQLQNGDAALPIRALRRIVHNGGNKNGKH